MWRVRFTTRRNTFQCFRASLCPFYVSPPPSPKSKPVYCWACCAYTFDWINTERVQSSSSLHNSVYRKRLALLVRTPSLLALSPTPPHGLINTPDFVVYNMPFALHATPITHHGLCSCWAYGRAETDTSRHNMFFVPTSKQNVLPSTYPLFLTLSLSLSFSSRNKRKENDYCLYHSILPSYAALELTHSLMIRCRIPPAQTSKSSFQPPIPCSLSCPAYRFAGYTNTCLGWR